MCSLKIQNNKMKDKMCIRFKLKTKIKQQAQIMVLMS